MWFFPTNLKWLALEKWQQKKHIPFFLWASISVYLLTVCFFVCVETKPLAMLFERSVRMQTHSRTSSTFFELSHSLYCKVTVYFTYFRFLHNKIIRANRHWNESQFSTWNHLLVYFFFPTLTSIGYNTNI